MPEKIEAKGISDQMKKDLAREVETLQQLGIRPKMSVILCTEDFAAVSYAKSKEKVAGSLGIIYEIINLGEGSEEIELLDTIERLNADADNHGILLELPVNKNIDPEKALERILPVKDIDGLTPVNLGLICMSKEDNAIVPATPQACIRLAESVVNIPGKKVAVIGRGKTVGKPLINMLINRDATVTSCHTKTVDIKEATKDCELVFVAIGRPHAIGLQQLHPGQIIIDAGINFSGGKMVGDVSSDAYEICRAYTPVPGGVGTLTSTIIFRNLLKATKIQAKYK